VVYILLEATGQSKGSGQQDHWYVPVTDMYLCPQGGVLSETKMLEADDQSEYSFGEIMLCSAHERN
jgi:hypothetical protein